MTKFTPEYIAKCRKEKGGVWVFPEAKTALDEIEQLTSLVERLIEAGNYLVTAENNLEEMAYQTNWQVLAAEWMAR